MTSSDCTYEWFVIDFRPQVEPGWRIVYVANTDGTIVVEPLLGWLIRERRMINKHTGQVVHDDNAVLERDVVAASLNDYKLYPVDTESDYWKIIAPGDSLPSAKEASYEQQRRKDIKQAYQDKINNAVLVCNERGMKRTISMEDFKKMMKEEDIVVNDEDVRLIYYKWDRQQTDGLS